MINRAQIPALLRPALAAVFGMLGTYKDEWQEIFSTTKSDLAQEIEVEMKYLGAADIKAEGAPSASDSMYQGFTTSYLHRMVSLSFVMTIESLQDNQYQKDFPQQATSLRDSLRTTKNILGANILNNAFDAAYPIGDGQSLCSVAHPIDGGTYSNRLVQNVDFSEAGVEQAIIQIQAFPMLSGILANTMAQKLLVPKEIQFDASRLLNSAFRVDTANNDINALYHNDYIPKGYTINHYLNNPAAWFVLTDSKNGFKHYQRSPVETDTYADPSTLNVTAIAYERYSFGCSNSRAVFGSLGV